MCRLGVVSSWKRQQILRLRGTGSSIRSARSISVSSSRVDAGAAAMDCVSVALVRRSARRLRASRGITIAGFGAEWRFAGYGRG